MAAGYTQWYKVFNVEFAELVVDSLWPTEWCPVQPKILRWGFINWHHINWSSNIYSSYFANVIPCWNLDFFGYVISGSILKIFSSYFTKMLYTNVDKRFFFGSWVESDVPGFSFFGWRGGGLQPSGALFSPCLT